MPDAHAAHPLSGGWAVVCVPGGTDRTLAPTVSWPVATAIVTPMAAECCNRVMRARTVAGVWQVRFMLKAIYTPDHTSASSTKETARSCCK